MTRSVPTLALALFATPLMAQQRAPTPPTPPAPPAPPTMAWNLSQANPNAARLGITLGAANTEGILVEEISAGGPAEKAGLKVGDRLVAINDISLRMDAADLEDPALAGMMSRRLQRTMADKKPGDAVTLRVLSGGSQRTVTLNAVAERDLRAASTSSFRALRPMTAAQKRARLGVSLGGSPSKRDTAGVFVSGVTTDGPAEKAGIVEGDRIARVNGVDLRVPREDAGDATMSQARVERLQRELAKLSPGDVVTLTVVSAGRSRELRVTTDSTTAGAATMFFRDGQLLEMPAIRELLPRLQGEAMDRATRVRVEESLQRAMEATERARESMERIRIEAPNVRIQAPNVRIETPARVRVNETIRTVPRVVEPARVRVLEGTRTRITI